MYDIFRSVDSFCKLHVSQVHIVALRYEKGRFSIVKRVLWIDIILFESFLTLRCFHEHAEHLSYIVAKI
jgi:hypothetical protein